MIIVSNLNLNILTFRKAVQQLELLKEKNSGLLKKYEDEVKKWINEFKENLLKRIQNVDVVLDTSYRSISKYNFEELREYQVFIYFRDRTILCIFYTLHLGHQ